MKKWLTQAKTDLSGQISRNGNFFTIAAIVFILITGTNLASGNKNWWQSSLAILVVLGLVFSFLQARVVLKALATILIAALTSQMALQSGIIFNAKSSIGLVWMLNQFLLLFLCLAISYLSIGSRSRWTATWVGLIASSLISVSLVSSIHPGAALIISNLLSVTVFWFWYRGAFGIKIADMPKYTWSDEMAETVAAHCDAEGWSYRVLIRKTKGRKNSAQKTILAWNNKQAFLFYPVSMDRKFGISAAKRGTAGLTYNSAPINPWLLELVNTAIPLWRSRNAPITLVLLDVNNANGGTIEAIGVSIPDTKKKIPVGVAPAKVMLNGVTKKSFGSLSKIATALEVWTESLAEKHVIAMSEIGQLDKTPSTN